MRQYALGGAVTLAFMVLALLSCSGCAKEFHGKDLAMMEQVKVLSEALSNYHLTYAEWPESLEEVRPHLAYGASWPDNPYNGQPITDTGSPDFDAATSVGNVYYEKLYRDERLINYQLHVFGERGKLVILGNTAFGLKE